MKRLGILLLLGLMGQVLAHGLEFTYNGAALTGPNTYAGTGYAELSLDNAGAEGYDLSLMRLSAGKTLADYQEAGAALGRAYAGQGDVVTAHRAIQETVTIIGGVTVRSGRGWDSRRASRTRCLRP